MIIIGLTVMGEVIIYLIYRIEIKIIMTRCFSKGFSFFILHK